MNEIDELPALKMSGYLKKKGMKDQRWHRRYVELVDKLLSFYKDETKKEMEVKIEIKKDTTVQEIKSAQLQRFEIKSKSFTIELTHESEQIMHQWIAAVKNAANLSNGLTMDDFIILSVIGRGFFGKVMLVQHKATGETYAVKSIQKKKLIDMRKCYVVITERNILLKTHHPFIIKLCFAFQTSAKFYLGLEYASGGEMFFHMSQRGSIPADEIRLYAAEIALALDYMHSQGIIYRDMKPENVLLDVNGHIKITDFGMSKDISQTGATSTFCGTTEYLAPELVLRNKYSYETDWWALGILMYEMFVEDSPFSDSTNIKVYANILNNQPKYPPEMPIEMQEAINMLLVKDPHKRANLEILKTAKYFENIDWDKVYNCEYQPLFVPEIRENTIPENFDEEFTAETPIDSVVPAVSVDLDGFSYFNNNFENK